ncbi:MAG: FMN-binding negative transcriptional regulator [Myxococcota bacterium]
MYVPKFFRIEDPQVILSLIEEHPLGALITPTPAQLHITHVPFGVYGVYGVGPGARLGGHMARANPHWRVLSDHPAATVVFSGPNAYVSPTWYDHRNVPTWNYLAIHVHGPVTVITEPEARRRAMSAQVDRYESARPDPYRLGEQPDDFVHAQMRGIVVFELQIERMECTAKLSQNRDANNRAAIMERLRARGRTADAATAALMERLGRASDEG